MPISHHGQLLLPEYFRQRYGSLCTIEEGFTLAEEAAAQRRGWSSPNPAVGAVILDVHGAIVGIGATEPPGGAHAEIVALQEAGEAAKGGTALVTLEPCNCWGRTGPCSHALAAAQVSRVLYRHPDPTSAAGGAEYLRSQGIDCQQYAPTTPVPSHVDGWVHRIATGNPRVTAKMAASMDGFSAAADGSSQWITSSAARAHAHQLRSQMDAIIVGTGTLLADNPSLTARYPSGELFPHQPQRIIVGSRHIEGEEPTDVPNLYTLPVGSGWTCAPAVHVRTRSWSDVMDYCREQPFLDVLLEGGPTVVGSAIHHGVADLVLAYLAPIFMGQGLGSAPSSLVETLAEAPRYQIEELTQVGEDICVLMKRMRGCSPD